jgi:hypothetical protein
MKEIQSTEAANERGVELVGALHAVAYVVRRARLAGSGSLLVARVFGPVTTLLELVLADLSSVDATDWGLISQIDVTAENCAGW